MNKRIKKKIQNRDGYKSYDKYKNHNMRALDSFINEVVAYMCDHCDAIFGIPRELLMCNSKLNSFGLKGDCKE